MKKDELKKSSKLFQTGASYVEFIFIILLVALLGIPALRDTGFEVGEATCKTQSKLNEAGLMAHDGTQVRDYHYVMVDGKLVCTPPSCVFGGAGSDCTPPSQGY